MSISSYQQQIMSDYRSLERQYIIAFFVENIYDLNCKIKDDNQIIIKIYVF